MPGRRQQQQNQPSRPVAADENVQPTSSFLVKAKDESKVLGSATTATMARVTFSSLPKTQPLLDGAPHGSSSASGQEGVPSGTHVNAFNTLIAMRNENDFPGRDSNDFLDMRSTSISHRSDNDESEMQDARRLQDALVEAFPQSLKHITVDEAAVEALSSDNPEVATNNGYHRQFTELTLREVYGLLTQTAAMNDMRLKYLLSQNLLDLDEQGLKAFELSAKEESARSLSEWDDVWYQALQARSGILVSVTVRPPQFMAGMLWNGVNLFLLGGTAFLQEGRILQIRMPQSNLCLDSTTSLPMTSGTALNSSDAVSNKNKHQVRLLLREFISVSKVGMGCMVQTFSLIPEHVSVKVARNQALPYNLIQTVLDQCTPGAVTRGFSLQMLLPPSLRPLSNMQNAEETFGSISAYSRTVTGQSMDCLESTRTELNESYLAATEVWSSPATHARKVPMKKKSVMRQPLGNETYLLFTNSKLYALVMQHSPAVLTAHTNAIREYLKYSQRLRFQRLVRRLLTAVHTIQRFFRHCLAKKKCAVSRMLRLWKQLELDSRDQLKRHTLSPTTVDRIDFIVGTILWQYVITTEEYKLAMLEEQFSIRRAAYKKWCMQRLEEERAKYETMQKEKKTSKILLLENVDKKEEAEKEENEESIHVHHFEEEEESSMPLVKDGEEKKEMKEKKKDSVDLENLHYPWISKWEDVLHTRFGWYIEPEELLAESHRRLLISLRNSILTTAEVQEELMKRVGERITLLPL